MKKVFNKILKSFIQRARKSKLLLSLFEAPIDINTFEKKGEFITSKGKNITLYKNLRDKVKPGWQNFLVNQGKKVDYSDEKINQSINNSQYALDRIIPLISSNSKEIKDSVILEIGCHLGSTSYLLAEKGAKEVYATDFSGYKAKSANTEDFTEKTLNEIDTDLKNAREKLREKFSNGNRVHFFNDDICNSQLPKEKFDLILSFDVLEHISNIDEAFKTISERLNSGGIAIHEYNPFFSLNGGHSACTLDFPWGHVRLSAEDFNRYIDEIRPDEKILAKSFYKEGLNRMTGVDLENYSLKNNLTTTILYFTKEQHVRMLTSEILEDSIRNYPSLKLSDLVAPKVIVIQKKGK